MRILLVDDDESILALLKQYLSASCGHDVSACAGGIAALELLERTSEPFDCFILDIQMPQIDGIELCKRIRAIAHYSETSIIMLTAMAQLDHLDRAFAAGANDYITKPFELGELSARIKSSQRFAQEQAESASAAAKADRSVDEALTEAPAEVPDAPDGTAFPDVIDIHNVDRVLGYTAFENYIMQLPRFGMFLSTICAIRILNADKAHRICSDEQFQKIIQAVAGVISDTMKRDSCFISYRGAGVFLCIQNGRSVLSRDDIEQPLNRRLQLALAQLPVDVSLELAVGKQHPLRWVTKSGALRVLFNAARSADETSGAPVPERPRDTTLVDFQEHRNERSDRAEGAGSTQSYKSLLNELLVEEEVYPRHLNKISKGNGGT
ncbi:MAG: response regulator transcription factor [Pseudomonadota bacterium]|uniref:response regulator transcription factor n=1 Tax=Roseovarius TaxID=74030 RepID=UPI0022A7D66B|nr:response regulator transcription factor [Roseovarius sp. EGI FJ00037]MCZ0811696.1 response regulator transcription factor [Roseovarius sp. EGI FJ00037]